MDDVVLPSYGLSQVVTLILCDHLTLLAASQVSAEQLLMSRVTLGMHFSISIAACAV